MTMQELTPMTMQELTPMIGFSHNAVEFRNMFKGTAITIGNLIMYGDGHENSPAFSQGVYDQYQYDSEGYRIGNNAPSTWMHEIQHTYQAQLLGPLYLLSNGLGMATSVIAGDGTHGPLNWNERGPQSWGGPKQWNFSGSYPY